MRDTHRGKEETQGEREKQTKVKKSTFPRIEDKRSPTERTIY